MKIQILVFLGALCVFCLHNNAQSPETCPLVNIYGPAGLVQAGEITGYNAVVDTKGRNLPLTFVWSTSAGTIKSGQGSDKIEVIQPPRCLTVTVDVGGLPDGCPTAFSEATCGDPAPESEKVADVKGTLNKGMIAVISKAIENHRHVMSQMYFVVSAPRNNRKELRRKIKILKTLFRSDPTRATFVISGTVGNQVVVWAVPPGATLPTP